MCVCVCLHVCVHIINPAHFSKMRCVFMMGQKAESCRRVAEKESGEDALSALQEADHL